jgi:DNA-binding NarL/FixJ family response regulator
MVRVIVADDHHLVRQGIGMLLEKADDIEVIGEAEDGLEAVELAERLTPDVVVMDVSMPRLNGVQATELIRARLPATQVVVLSMHSDETTVRQALRRGAKAYVLKRSVGEELLLAVRAASRGETYLSPPIAGSILRDYLTRSDGSDDLSDFERLTPREREVLQLLAEGRTNVMIAKALVVSVKTVEKHRSSLMSKLNIHDLAGLVRFAIRNSLVSADQ